MPYAVTSDGVRIHYTVEGAGPPMLLAHWFAGSGVDWRDFGYVDALCDSFQLILVDARGHGQSDKPHDRRVNTTDHVARDHLAVLDDLGIAQAHFFGYSSGGSVAFAAALMAPERFRSLVIGGTDPWWSPEWITAGEEMIALLNQGMEATLAAWEAWLGPWPEPLRQRTLANDPQALAARFANSDLDPGYRERLPEMTHPALIYRAEGDPQAAHAAETATLMPNARFLEIPGVNHASAFYRSELVIPFVREFISTLT